MPCPANRLLVYKGFTFSNRKDLPGDLPEVLVTNLALYKQNKTKRPGVLEAMLPSLTPPSRELARENGQRPTTVAQDGTRSSAGRNEAMHVRVLNADDVLHLMSYVYSVQGSYLLIIQIFSFFCQV